MSLYIAEFMEGARNFYRYFNVKRGDHVLLVPTSEFVYSDPLALEALTAAAREIGAEPLIFIITKPRGRQLPEVHPEPLTRALMACDLFLGLGIDPPNPISGHCVAALTARWDHGVKQADLAAGRGKVLATEWARFPPEKIFAMGRRLFRSLEKARAVHVTSPNGTDLIVDYDPYLITGSLTVPALEYGYATAGMRATYPLGVLGFLSDVGTQGKAVLDCLSGHVGKLDHPVNWTVKENRVTDIAGGEEAARVRAEIEGLENADYIALITIGLNPKARLWEGLMSGRHGEAQRHEGVVRIALGDRPGGNNSPMHGVSGEILDATVEVNGELIVDRGRLPVLREITE